MSKVILSIHLFGLLLISACAPRPLSQGSDKAVKQLDQLQQLMSGSFSSAEQAANDSLFYDISLVMQPIWPEDKAARWLYVEQAVSANKKKPYRQRVYRLSLTSDSQIESRVYELPDPAKFIHAWDRPEAFVELGPDDLKLRTGCAVYLKPQGKNCFAGSTRDKECLSALRGASYATSSVEICPGQIESWDQGWNAEDEQVWGAVTGGYVFKKI